MAELGKYHETASLGQGKYQTTIGIKPVNYKDNIGWKRIVNDWADSGIPAYPHIVTHAPFMARVSPDGGRQIHPTREEDVWFRMSGAKENRTGKWVGLRLGVPTRRVGNQMTWVRGNYDAQMDMAGHFIKLSYLLKHGYMPPNDQFAFEIETHGLTRAGDVFSKDGVPVMHMRAPVAYDYDNPLDVRQIAHEITRIDGKWHVVFTLPSLVGMSKPVIDPTLTLQPDAAAGNDNFIYEGAATNNYGINAKIYSSDDPGVEFKSLLKFDVSSIASSAIIDSATLSLVWESQTVNGNTTATHNSLVAFFEGEKDTAVPGATDGSTWNHRNANTGGQVAWTGGAGGVAGTEYDASASDTTAVDGLGTYTWDVKSIVESWLTTNHGLWLIGSVTEKLVRCHSSDYGTAGDRPKLVVDYTVGSGSVVAVRAPGWGRY